MIKVGAGQERRRLRKEGDNFYFRDRWIFQPSGICCVSIGPVRGVRNNWNEGKRYQLNDLVEKVVNGIEQAAKQIKINREEDIRLEIERQEAEKRFRERQHREYIEKRWIDDLLERVDLWHRSCQIWAYLEEVKSAARRIEGQIPVDSAFRRWLAWAEKATDRLDPTIAQSVDGLYGPKRSWIDTGTIECPWSK